MHAYTYVTSAWSGTNTTNRPSKIGVPSSRAAVLYICTSARVPECLLYPYHPSTVKSRLSRDLTFGVIAQNTAVPLFYEYYNATLDDKFLASVAFEQGDCRYVLADRSLTGDVIMVEGFS